MDTSVVFTRQIDNKNIAVKPFFNYQKANKYYTEFEKHYHINSNYEAYKNLEQALLNRPAYNEYLLNKSYLLQRLGYTDEAFNLYRNAIKNKKANHAIYTTSNYLKKRISRNYYSGFDNDTESLMLKKSPKTHKLRKYLATACLGLLFSLSAQVVKSQEIEGYVRNTSGNALENVRIEAIYQNDTTQRKSTTSDYSGFYQLNDIITSDNPISGFESDEIRLFYDGQQVIVKIKSQHKIQIGRLYTLNGKTIAATEFTQTGSNEYISKINITGLSENILLFSDGVHPAKKIILSMLPLNGAETVYSSVNDKDKTNSLKSAKSDINTFIFRLDDPDDVDTYQTLEITKDIDMLNQNNIDFEMTPWPEFYADLQIYVSNYEQLAMQGVDIALENIESGQVYTTTSNSTGNATINNIFIPAFTLNRLLADTVDFKLTLGLADYREIIDTLNLTEALCDTSYVLYPTAWKAILDANAKEALTKENASNIEVKLWEEGLPETATTMLTDADGNVTFQEDIPYINGEDVSDTINYFIEVLGPRTNQTRDIKLYEGNFIENFLVGDNFGLVINSNDGTNPISVNYKALDGTDTTQVIGTGMTDANGIDTLKFFNRDENLEVILKTWLADHDSARTVVNMNQNEFTTQAISNNPSTPQEAVAYLFRGLVHEIENTGTLSDIVLVNEEFNYRDTIFNIGNQISWKDTVPVNAEGNTEYQLKIIPHNTEGQIPLHILEKTLSLQANQSGYMGTDTLKALAQEQKLKGWVKRFEDKQLTSLMDIIIESYDGTFRDSIRSTNGYYESKPLNVAEEGTGFEGYIIVKPLGADSTDHLGLYKIPITTKEMTIDDINALTAAGGTYKGRPIVIPEKLTNFEDSTKQVNFMLTPKELTDPYTGAKLKVNPYHIRVMEGEPINASLARYGIQNVYLYGDVDVAKYEGMKAHMATLFGAIFNENKVATPRNITAEMVSNYNLQSEEFKEFEGTNVWTGGNSTTIYGPDNVEGLSLIIGSDMVLSLDDTASVIREFGRHAAINSFPSSIRESVMNTSIPPEFPDTLNIEDRCYIPLFMDHRKEQVKSSLLERTHNNLGYLRDVKNFYNGQTLEEIYGN